MLKRAPYKVGEEVHLRSTNPSNEVLLLTNPLGGMVPLPAPRGQARFEVSTAGEWSYTWEDGDAGKFTVVEGSLEFAEPQEVIPNTLPRIEGA